MGVQGLNGQQNPADGIVFIIAPMGNIKRMEPLKFLLIEKQDVHIFNSYALLKALLKANASHLMLPI